MNRGYFAIGIFAPQKELEERERAEDDEENLKTYLIEFASPWNSYR